MSDLDWSQFQPVSDDDPSVGVQAQFASLTSAFPDAQVSSLTRSEKHNAEVGGVPTSQHIPRGESAFGTAMDVVVPKDQRSDFQAHASSLGLQAIDEGTHIHLQLPHGSSNVDWSKFEPVDAPPKANGVDWSQFRPAEDFSNVQSGGSSSAETQRVYNEAVTGAPAWKLRADKNSLSRGSSLEEDLDNANAVPNSPVGGNFGNVVNGGDSSAPNTALGRFMAEPASNLPGAALAGLQEGGAEFGKWLGMATAGAAGLVDKAAGTNLQDAAFKGLVEPEDKAAQFYADKLDKMGTASQIVGGTTKAVPDLLVGLMGGAEEEAAVGTTKVVQGLYDALMGTITTGAKMAAPLAAKSGAEAYGQAITDGKAPWDAATDALKTIGSTEAMGLLGSGAEGNLVSRVAQSGAAAAGTSEAIREMEGRPFNPVELGTNLAIGGAFGVAGHDNAAPREAPRAPVEEAFQDIPNKSETVNVPPGGFSAEAGKTSSPENTGNVNPQKTESKISPQTPSLITQGENANGKFTQVGDQGAGTTSQISHNDLGVFDRTNFASGRQSNHAVLNQEGDFVNPNDIRRNPNEKTSPEELAWVGTPEERQFVVDQHAKTKDLNDPYYKDRSQIIKDLVTGDISLDEARARADALNKEPQETPTRVPVQADQTQAPQENAHPLFDDLVPKEVGTANAEVAAPAKKPEVGEWQYDLDTGQNKRVYTAKDLDKAVEQSNAPREILKDYHEGTLTTGKLLDGMANDTSGRVEDSHKTLAKYLLAAGKRFGGLDVGIGRYNGSDPVHAAEKAPANMPQGYYHPFSNAIRLGSDAPNQHLMLHETVHALTNRATVRGARGLLDGQAQHAYDGLNALFQGFKNHLQSTGEVFMKKNSKGEDVINHYGFHNVDEYLAEFFSNPKFRDVLKNTKLDSITTESAGGAGRRALGVVRNMYTATVRGIRNMLGLPEKAETALHASFAAAHQFLGNLAPEHLGDLRSLGLKPAEMAGEAPISKAQIDAQAKAAIAKGADPEKVRQRVQDLYAQHGHTNEPFVTGIKNATVTSERAAKGQDEIVNNLSRGKEAMRAAAEKTLEDNPKAGEALAAAIIRKPRPLSGEDVMVLALDRARLHQEQRAATARGKDAIHSGDQNAELLSQMEVTDLNAKMEANDKAASYAGTENSLGLSARQAMVKEDFSLAHMVNKETVARGRKLTQAETDQVKALHQKIEDLQEKLAQKESTRVENKRAKVPMNDKAAADKEFASLSKKLKEMNNNDKRGHCIV